MIFLKSKLQQVIVTESREDYEGSLTLCPDLMEAAGLFEYEQVHVNNFNGNRDITYVLKGKPGQVCINGALSRRHKVGDKIHVLAYTCPEFYGHGYKPKVVKTNSKNMIIG